MDIFTQISVSSKITYFIVKYGKSKSFLLVGMLFSDINQALS